MVKSIFTIKPSSIYDDSVEKYHFPKTYLNQVKKSLGDWVIYYEPRRISHDLGSSGGRQAYYATARVTRIEKDQAKPNHFYAHISDFLPFDKNVPFKERGGYYENRLKKQDGTTNKGQFGRAVRSIDDFEYDAILRAGFEIALIGEDRFYENRKIQSESKAHGAFYEIEQQVFERPIVERLIKLPFRDVAFRHAVRGAYNDTCAMTGMQIKNGGGRPEVQAAHIMPVAANGPDSVNNGIALSGTIHWMFDRGLISIDDDYSILTANDELPSQVKSIILKNRKINLPERLDARPHPKYLAHHRETVFKG